MHLENTESLILAFRNERDVTKFVTLSLLEEKTIPELIAFTTHKTYPYPQYSSWLLIHIAEKHPERFLPYHQQLIDQFLILKDPSAQRNLANCLTKLHSTTYREGELLDALFNQLIDSNSKVAVKVYAMYLIVDFIKKFPELKSEFVAIIEKNLVHESPAYHAAARKVMKQLAKIH